MLPHQSVTGFPLCVSRPRLMCVAQGEASVWQGCVWLLFYFTHFSDVGARHIVLDLLHPPG